MDRLGEDDSTGVAVGVLREPGAAGAAEAGLKLSKMDMPLPPGRLNVEAIRDVKEVRGEED
jgi:hypothetical protein